MCGPWYIVALKLDFSLECLQCQLLCTLSQGTLAVVAVFRVSSFECVVHRAGYWVHLMAGISV